MGDTLMALLAGIAQVTTSPGGQAALLALFKDYGVPQDKLDEIIRMLPTPRPPKE